MQMGLKRFNVVWLVLMAVGGNVHTTPLEAKTWRSRNPGVPAAITMKILESSPTRTKIRLTVPGFNQEEMKIGGQLVSKVSIPGVSSTDKKGFPALPRFSKNIQLPWHGQVRYRILQESNDVYQVGTVAPSKGPIMRDVLPQNVPYEFSAFYDNGGVFPQQVIELGKPFILRNARGVTINFFPIRYDRVLGQLTVARELVLELLVSQPKDRKTTILKQGNRVNPEFVKIYANTFKNFNQLRTSMKAINPEHIVAENRSMLVIAHPDFLEGIQPFISWKRQIGMDVRLVSTADTGATHEEIKAYIQTDFDERQVAYVHLVGDAEFVAFYKGKSGNALGNEADPMYGLLAGDDGYPDLFVSRFSVKTIEELETVVYKSINYEKHPDIRGDWYHKGIGMASNEGNPTDFERAELLRTALEAWDYSEIDKLYDPGVRPQDVNNAINAGRGFINYLGHGSKTSWGTSGFNNGYIDALENGNKLPFIVSVACVNGEFGAGADAFAEKWIKAGTKDNPKGAIAIFAASTNQSWVPPTVGQKEIVNLLVTEQANTIGGLFINGSVAVLEDNSSTADQTYETWHIFGDASLQVRTRYPTPIQVEVPATLFLGFKAVRFSVGEPNVNVGLVQDGILLGSGISDQNGDLQVDFKEPLQKPGVATLTFNGFNKIPAIFQVPIAPPVQVAFDPQSITIKASAQGTAIKISIKDAIGNPAANVLVWGEQFNYKSDVVYTNELGVAILEVQTANGPTVQIKAKREADDYFLLDKAFPITGGEEFSGLLGLFTEVKLEGAFAVGFNGSVSYSLLESGMIMYLLSNNEIIDSSSSEINYTPMQTGEYSVILAKPGFNIRRQAFQAILALGNVNINVLSTADQPLANVSVLLMDVSSRKTTGTTSAEGLLFEDLPVGDYQVSLTKFGYVFDTRVVRVNYGSNDLQLKMPDAETKRLFGFIKRNDIPARGSVRIYKDGEGKPFRSVDTLDNGFYEAYLPIYTYRVVYSSKMAKRQVITLVLSEEKHIDANLEPSSGILVLQRANDTSQIFQESIANEKIEVVSQNFADTDPGSWPDYSGIVVSLGKANVALGIEDQLIQFVQQGGKVFAEGGEVLYNHRSQEPFREKVLLAKEFKSEKVAEIIIPEGSPIGSEKTIQMPANWGASDTFIPMDNAISLGFSATHEGETVIASNGANLFISLDVSQIPNEAGERDNLIRGLVDYWLKGK